MRRIVFFFFLYVLLFFRNILSVSSCYLRSLIRLLGSGSVAPCLRFRFLRVLVFLRGLGHPVPAEPHLKVNYSYSSLIA